MLAVLYPVNCWKPLNMLRQSAGNLVNVQEVFRGHTLEVMSKKFCKYNSYLKNQIREYSQGSLALSSMNKLEIEKLDTLYIPNEGENKVSSKFSSYLAGLIEGDGCIWVPKKGKERDSWNKVISPLITISFNSKDLPLVLILQERLGTGRIVKNKGKNAYTYRISNYINLVKIVNIINGYMRTPKINQLNNLIDFLNAKGYNIKKYPIDVSFLNSNGWLAGFIDSDGHFSVRLSIKGQNVKKTRVSCSLEITQRQVDLSGGSLYTILSLIGEFLLAKVKITKSKYSIKAKFRIRTTSLEGNIILKNYLNNYPIFSSKYLDYLDWCTALDLFERNIRPKPLDKIAIIKSNMNDNRTYFTWDHLQNFYRLID